MSSLALLAGLSLAPAPAQADRLRDHVEADSFGNLVVWSRSGYKRIVVGQGHLAGELEAYVGGSPRVIDGVERDAYENSADDYDGPVLSRKHRRHGSFYHHCYRPPVFVKGRAYMYGLADGEMPVLSRCERFSD